MFTSSRYLFFAIGIVLVLALIVILFLFIHTPTSCVGTLYVAGVLLAVIGMVFAPWGSGRSLALTFIGGALLITTAAVRMISPPSGSRLKLITLPGQSGPRWMNRILDEQDVVLYGAQIAPFFGAVSSRERKSLVFSLSNTYEEMRIQGLTPLSPFLMTYLNQQRPSRFDVLVAEPVSRSAPATGIIFLHGHGGNFTLQCWLIAKVGLQMGAITVCPSTDPTGRWWNEQGVAILQETLAYIQNQGVDQIYLAGLSNGGIGASRLADRYKSDLAGLILISGADPAAAITELPILVLHGKYDERIPVSWMEEYVHAAGAHAAYHLFEGDHFLLLKQADEVQEVISGWLEEH